tara:strand:- start:1034 stop:3367 length:2334 start_codon:yes stop_codon:yes gene_type:complete
MTLATYTGRVSSVVYENGDFRVVRVLLDGGSSLQQIKPITVRGNFPAQHLKEGSWVSFEGKWEKHESYGSQLAVTKSPAPVAEWTDERVDSALSANGVGPSSRLYLRKYAHTQECSLHSLLDEGDLSKIKDLDNFDRLFIVARWKALRTYLSTMSFLGECGLSSSVITKVWSSFKENAEEILSENPWALVQVEGVTFDHADEVARKMGISLDHTNRLQGAILHTVQNAVMRGHVYASTGQIVEMLKELTPNLSQESVDISKALKTLHESKTLIIDKDAGNGIPAVYVPWQHQMEERCAVLLRERNESADNEEILVQRLVQIGDGAQQAHEEGGSVKDIAHAALADWSKGCKITLTPEQQEAAVKALIDPVAILTGLPGTGKTTTLKAVVSLLQDAGITFLLAAPTGIAAKRMASVVNAAASTIHRAFKAKNLKTDTERESTYLGIVGDSTHKTEATNQSEQWAYGPDNPHPAQVVVIDETSMLDLHMLYRVLEGTSPTCRLVLVGDPFQLPSVGAGDVLRQLVQSEFFSHSHLDQIFRQEDTSGIVIAAHAVHKGESPESDGKDFVLVPAFSDSQAAELVVDIAKGLYERRANFQVLSPRHGGLVGVTALNQKIRAALNPAAPGLAEIRLPGGTIREDDRSMVVRNDYELNIYNGDVGKIVRIDRRSKTIEMRIHDIAGKRPRHIQFPVKDAGKLIRLAYAQTVHKAQGQEYEVIVMPVLASFGRQLQRNLFYTGITRATRKVILVGQPSAIDRAVANNVAEHRNTHLASRIQMGGS